MEKAKLCEGRKNEKAANYDMPFTYLEIGLLE